jgi:DNA polymerase I-like protein with 3'-5' exonuclease and polymerase domains
MFWQDIPASRKKSERVLIRPPVPETGWRAPTEFPNLSQAVVLSIDTEAYDPELETSGPGWARGSGCVVGFSVGAKDAHGNYGQWYFPIQHFDSPEENLDPNNALRWLAHTLSNPLQPKVGANLLYDVGWLKHEGIEVAGPLFDVQHAEALLDERAKVGLDVLATKYLGEHKEGSLLYQWCSDYYGGPVSDRQRKNIYRAPPSLVGPYGEADAALPLRIMEAQWPLLAKEGLVDLFTMECELIPLLVAMRFEGVPVDVGQAEELYEDLGGEVDLLNQEVEKLVGFHVNVNSGDDLARAFDAMRIPYEKTPPSERNPEGRPSFTADFLERVDHPLGRLVVDVRQREKLRGTFIKSYILDNHVNGVVHGTFNQLRGEKGGTRSGRFSSDSPNLQNIPTRTELGKKIRRIFGDKLGKRKWRKYDYSQIEYRFLVHFAVGPGSDEIRAAYNADPDLDYHKITHGMILGITGLDLIRAYVKNINFGLIYGEGETSLSHNLGVSLAKGREMFAAYHKAVPYAKSTMEACSQEAERYGTISTILGRKSRFDLWEPGNWQDKRPPLSYASALNKYGGNIKRAYAYRALNRKLQGSAADQMKMAMHRCWKDGIFAETGVPALTVHDELDFLDPGGRDKAFLEMQRVMETCIPLRIPVRADYEIGPNWGDVAEP